jgi:hypothetical protein
MEKLMVMHLIKKFPAFYVPQSFRKACKYSGVEENHNLEHKNDEEKLKKEYVRRLRLILYTELSAKKK